MTSKEIIIPPPILSFILMVLLLPSARIGCSCCFCYYVVFVVVFVVDFAATVAVVAVISILIMLLAAGSLLSILYSAHNAICFPFLLLAVAFYATLQSTPRLDDPSVRPSVHLLVHSSACPFFSSVRLYVHRIGRGPSISSPFSFLALLSYFVLTVTALL